MKKEKITSTISKAQAEGEDLKHITGQDEAVTLICTMLALNATTYKFETELIDKETGDPVGTYEITIRKKD